MIPLGIQEFHGYNLTAPPREAPGGLLMVGEEPGGSRSVLIKVADLPDTPDRDERIRAFLRDIERVRALGDRDHLAIVDAGVEQDHGWVVHVAPAGPDLRPFLRRSERLPIPCIVQAVARLAWVVHRAHEAGILHLALSPESVYIHPARTQLSDFGFHHLMSTPPRLYEVGSENPSRLDPRADVYGIGLLLYHLSTGVHPLARRSGGRAAKRGYIAPPNWWDPGLSSALSEICERALAEDPGDRYASARSLARALEELPELVHGGVDGVDWPVLRADVRDMSEQQWLSEEVVVGTERGGEGRSAPGGAGSEQVGAMGYDDPDTGIVLPRRLNLAAEPEPPARGLVGLEEAAAEGDDPSEPISWRSLKSFPVPISDGAIVLDLHHSGGRPSEAEAGPLARIIPWRPRVAEVTEVDDLDEGDALADEEDAEGPEEATLPQEAVAPLPAEPSAQAAPAPEPPARAPAPEPQDGPPLTVRSARGLRPRPLQEVPPPVGDWALDGADDPDSANWAEGSPDYGALEGRAAHSGAPLARPHTGRVVMTTILATLLFSIPTQHYITTHLLAPAPLQVASVPSEGTGGAPAHAPPPSAVDAQPINERPLALASQALDPQVDSLVAAGPIAAAAVGVEEIEDEAPGAPSALDSGAAPAQPPEEGRADPGVASAAFAPLDITTALEEEAPSPLRLTAADEAPPAGAQAHPAVAAPRPKAPAHAAAEPPAPAPATAAVASLPGKAASSSPSRVSNRAPAPKPAAASREAPQATRREPPPQEAPPLARPTAALAPLPAPSAPQATSLEAALTASNAPRRLGPPSASAPAAAPQPSPFGRPPVAPAATAAASTSTRSVSGLPAVPRSAGSLLDAVEAPVPPAPAVIAPSARPQTLGAPSSAASQPQAVAAAPAARADVEMRHPQPRLDRNHPVMVLDTVGAEGALVTLWWRTEAGPYTRTSMSPAGDGRYTARLPAPAGSEVQYFFETLDERGRRTNLREQDPFTLTVPRIEEPAAEETSSEEERPRRRLLR